MKFSEIKQFPHANYKVDIDWRFLETWLNQQAQDLDLQLDPPFQRGYKWTEEQKTDYVEYQLRGGFSGRDIFWNCPTWMRGNKKDDALQLVDGKQRLNAVRGFLNGEVTVFDGLTIADLDKLPSTKYHFVFHINNLQSQVEVVDWYLGMNTGGSIHTDEDLRSAYDYKNGLLCGTI